MGSLLDLRPAHLIPGGSLILQSLPKHKCLTYKFPANGKRQWYGTDLIPHPSSYLCAQQSYIPPPRPPNHVRLTTGWRCLSGPLLPSNSTSPAVFLSLQHGVQVAAGGHLLRTQHRPVLVGLPHLQRHVTALLPRQEHGIRLGKRPAKGCL